MSSLNPVTRPNPSTSNTMYSINTNDAEAKGESRILFHRSEEKLLDIANNSITYTLALRFIELYINHKTTHQNYIAAILGTVLIVCILLYVQFIIDILKHRGLQTTPSPYFLKYTVGFVDIVFKLVDKIVVIFVQFVSVLLGYYILSFISNPNDPIEVTYVLLVLFTLLFCLFKVLGININ